MLRARYTDKHLTVAATGMPFRETLLKCMEHVTKARNRMDMMVYLAMRW